MQTKALWGKGIDCKLSHIELEIIIHNFAYKEKDVF